MPTLFSMDCKIIRVSISLKEELGNRLREDNEGKVVFQREKGF